MRGTRVGGAGAESGALSVEINHQEVDVSFQMNNSGRAFGECMPTGEYAMNVSEAESIETMCVMSVTIQTCRGNWRCGAMTLRSGGLARSCHMHASRVLVATAPNAFQLD